jgi:aminoglycoside phosphotransferase (APT) family kinase protein
MAGFSNEQILNAIEMIRTSHLIQDKKSYVHGDLYHRHLLVDPVTLQLTGIIDWGDIHISHPALDLAVGMIFTPQAFYQFIHAYGKIDDNMIAILRHKAFTHAMSFLPYAFEHNNPHYKTWAQFQLNRALSFFAA